MVMQVEEFALAIIEGLGTNLDGEGKPLEASSQAKGRAEELIIAFKASTVTFLGGAITGVTAPGAPLVNGAGTGGKFVGLTPASASAFRSGAPDATGELEKEFEALIEYLTLEATVFFLPKTIKGTCTSTGTNPGPLTLGLGQPGRITDIDGQACIAFLATKGIFTGPESVNHYNAMFDYLKLNLELRYSSGEVTGTCPTGGGSLSGGAAAGGKVV